MKEQRKGILFLLPWVYPCTTGGIELFHYYFIQEICKFYDVHICTTCNRFPESERTKTHIYPEKMFCSHTLSLTFNQIRYLYRLRKRVHLIHIPYTSKKVLQFYYVILIKKIFHIPYVLRIHGGGMYPGRPDFLHQIWFNNASGIVAVSAPIKEEYEKRHGRPITLIPSMLPFQKTTNSRQELLDRYHIGPSDLVILFLGSLKRIKGPDILLDAFLSLEPEYIVRHHLKMLFVGDGAMRPELETKASQSKVSGHIRFLGNLPHERVCEAYAMGGIFCLPSLMEAHPLSLIEAMYHGLPVIGSDISTIKNIIHDCENGLLFASGDAENLSVKMKNLVENDALRLKLGKSALKSYHQTYNFNRMVQDYCDFYDSIMA